ncbi:hypothetical protein VKS41_002097 [Umbelopsis sp. WA50703]|jgi:malate synthase
MATLNVPNHKSDILSPEVLHFLEVLHKTFESRRQDLLKARVTRQKTLDDGQLPDFLQETAHIREDSTWKAAPIGPGLQDRRIEITGPVDRKLVINALNSDSRIFMADFEDSTAPTWDNMVHGQINLRDAVRNQIEFINPNGKTYALTEKGKETVLMVRPRGWHLDEKHVSVEGRPMSGAIFDFGVFFYHNAKALIEKGHGPYFYLPKMESHLEARLWNDIFNVAQDMLNISRGTIRATVLIETILAAFEMDEIIYELRDHSAGLNVGRWDYIFSFIKKLKAHRQYVLPDRSHVTMESPFMDAYVRLLIKTCHKRGVHAMGGMSAVLPIKNDDKANKVAMEKVRQDKLREVKAGLDGTWVAHPDLIPIARQVFDEYMPQPNQIHVRRDDVHVTAQDLLDTNVTGGISEHGIRDDIAIALAYMESWLNGKGCLPIHNLMEDAATAEISRAQLWQWVKHTAQTTEGRSVTSDWLLELLAEETRTAKSSCSRSSDNKFELASQYLATQITGEENKFDEFMTSLMLDDIVAVQEKHKL